LVQVAAAQCDSVPEDFVLEDVQDYVNEEVRAFQVISCLLFNSADLDTETFEKAMAYSIIWIGGTPNYKVQVKTDIAEFIKEEPELLYPYILALTLALRDFPSSTFEELESEAINYLFLHYTENGSYLKSKSLEKMYRKYKKGKLKSYLISLRKKR